MSQPGSPPPNPPPRDPFLKPTLPVRLQQVNVNAGVAGSSFSSTSLVGTATTSQSIWAAASQDLEEDDGVAIYRRQEVSASQYLASQPTQLVEQVAEIEESTWFACLRGRGPTFDVDLHRDKDQYIFGTSPNCTIRIPSNHWRIADTKREEPWFKLRIKQRKQSPDVVDVTLEALRTDVFVQKKHLPVGKTWLLRWGDTICGGPDETNPLFSYTFRNANSEGPTTVTGEKSIYTLEEDHLASGMYSRVYRALSREGHECACKLIDVLSREMNEQERESIQFEIDLLRNLSHDNIVRFIDYAQVQYKYYIFTEMIHGLTLHEHYGMQNNIFTEVETRVIFQQICEAVGYLHQHGIVHRDIKSENVMVTGDKPTVKLIDFGLARATSSQSVLKTRCGTRAYMAPETDLSDDNNGYGTAVDVWSLGVLLFRMLAGEYPFEDDQPVADASADQVGAERLLNNESNPRATSTYDRDWRPFVDRKAPRSPDVKLLLEDMLSVDPSKRISIQSVLRSDWMRMIEEELEKFDVILPAYRGSAFSSNNGSISEGEAWGQLDIVPGSIKTAPRKIMLVKDQYWFGRQGEALPDPEVDFRLSTSRALSIKHCLVYRKQDDFAEDLHLPTDQRRKKEVAMVADASHNGTFVNKMKIGHGMACQIVNGDVLGLVVPREDHVDKVQPEGFWFHESLKYTVTLFTQPAESFNSAKRRYEASEDIPADNKVRIKETVYKGEIWGELVDVIRNRRYPLAGSTVTIGRDKSCDVVLPSEQKAISRFHATLTWDGLHPTLINTGTNRTLLNGETIQTEMQLRQRDVIHIAPASAEKAKFEISFRGTTFKKRTE
ncbi:Checkpoint kinase 2 [Podila humilis]|nr:Checkpoint kinase 2 [Podila humilis]